MVPTGRSDCGVSRKIDEDLKEQIIYLKHHYPRMSAAAIYKQLQDNGSIRSGQLSESTICRFINQLVLQQRLTNNQDMRRYERPHINEVWCGDSSAGPCLKTGDGKKHRVYVIALIDDASRFILAADAFFNDTFVNLMSVMKSAVSKYGKPKVFNFDNGAAYKNRQMELLAARIGSVISSSSLEYTTVALSLPPNFISIFLYRNILSPYILKLQTILIEQKIFHAHDHKAFLISPRLFCSIYYNNLLK